MIGVQILETHQMRFVFFRASHVRIMTSSRLIDTMVLILCEEFV